MEMDARYQRRLEKLNATLLKKCEDLRNCKVLMVQKEANLRELRNQKVFSSLQLDLAMKELEELKKGILVAQRKYQEEFSQRLQLQDQIEQLEYQTEYQKHMCLQLFSKEANRSGAIEKLQSAHMNSQQHIKELESRLEEIQDHLLTKLQALDAIQEKNADLQREITSLKSTLGYVKGTGTAHCQMPSLPLQSQHTPQSRGNILSKPSEKVLYSRFMESTSAATLLPRKSSSRVVRFPIESLVTLQKSLAPSSSFLLQKQHLPGSSYSSLVTDALGQGQDYIKTLFGDSRKAAIELVGKSGNTRAPAEYLNSTASSAVGNLKIVEVHSDGHYMKILNSSPDKEESIGDYTLQQNLNGHPIAIFKFPPKIRMKASSEVTVWAACSKMPHKPPIDYLWKELEKFKSGSECTTILCNPGGQAVAWYTPINWHRKQLREEDCGNRILKNIRHPPVGAHQQKDRWENSTFNPYQTVVSQSPAERDEPDFIMREEKVPSILYPVQSSWCRSPNSPTHPHYSVQRKSAGKYVNSYSIAEPTKLVPGPGGICGTKSTAGSSSGKSRGRPTRSAGPNFGGVIYVGSAAPIGSALQKYFAHSSSNFRLLAQASLIPINFL